MGGSSKGGQGNYGQVSQNEHDELSASLVAPSPEDMATPASAVVRVRLSQKYTRLHGRPLLSRRKETTFIKFIF